MTPAEYQAYVETHRRLSNRANKIARWAAPYQAADGGTPLRPHARISFEGRHPARSGFWVDWAADGVEDQLHIPLEVLLAEDWKRAFLLYGIEHGEDWLVLAAEDLENLV